MFEMYPTEDYPRTPLLPLPESVVGPELKPFHLHAAYYCGDDEVLTDAEQSELDAYAHRQWQLDAIDNERFED